MKRSIDRLSVVAVVIGAAISLPACLWFDVHSVSISSASVGENPTVLVDRDINLSFSGAYTSDIRSLETGAVACGRPSGHEYKSGKHGVYTTDLVDYAGGDTRCQHLPKGQYQAEFCWTVLDPFRFEGFGKKICAKSNVFEIGEPK